MSNEDNFLKVNNSVTKQFIIRKWKKFHKTQVQKLSLTCAISEFFDALKNNTVKNGFL